jgi:IS30 family transposase
MRQEKDNKKRRKGKHLNHKERIQIETLRKKGFSAAVIAKDLDRHVRTIEREIKRGLVVHLSTDLTEVMEYSSDRAQADYDLNATAKGPDLKLAANYDLVEFVAEQIRDHKRSPDVVCAMMKNSGMPGAVCTKTLYSYIDQGLIAGVTNEDLWEKSKRGKRKWRGVRKMRKRPPERTGIDSRPDSITDRIEFGHWEIDLIKGGKGADKACLLTLVERVTRKLLIRKLPDGTQQSVVKALDRLETSTGAVSFRGIFKSITADNGSEFLDVEALEKSSRSKKRRTKFYYAHPYASWERGSNENANRMVRRFVAKGHNIGQLGTSFIRHIEEWINNYPRKIINFRTAEECFNQAIAA